LVAIKLVLDAILLRATSTCSTGIILGAEVRANAGEDTARLAGATKAEAAATKRARKKRTRAMVDVVCLET